MKRIAANDPVALCQEGGIQYNKGDYQRAFEYYAKSAALGDVEAHFNLSGLYHHGRGVAKDEGKMMYHYEEAAIGGLPNARFSLGVFELKDNLNTEKAAKHWIIAATQGCDDTIEC